MTAVETGVSRCARNRRKACIAGRLVSLLPQALSAIGLDGKGGSTRNGCSKAGGSENFRQSPEPGS